MCTAQQFLCYAQIKIKTWSFSDIEKTFPCPQYFLSVSGLFVSKILTILVIYQTWQLFFRESVLLIFLCEPVSKNFSFPRTRFNLNFQHGEHNWLISFSLPTNADRLHLCKLIDSEQKYLICFVFCNEDNSCGNLKNWQSLCTLWAQPAIYELCFWFSELF